VEHTSQHILYIAYTAAHNIHNAVFAIQHSRSADTAALIGARCFGVIGACTTMGCKRVLIVYSSSWEVLNRCAQKQRKNKQKYSKCSVLKPHNRG
jgi:hypothetical protein